MNGGKKIGGQLAFEASATVRNRSPEFRLFTVRTTLETRTGEVLATGSAAGFDATKTCLATGLEKCRGREIKVRFVGKDVSLYAFWFSDEKGASRGYLAGGGPGYKGLRDL